MHKYVVTPEGKAVPLGEKTIFSCDPVRNASVEEIGYAIYAQGPDGLYMISPKYLKEEHEDAFDAAITWLWEFLDFFTDDTLTMIIVNNYGWIESR